MQMTTKLLAMLLLLGITSTTAQLSASDMDILNFALNLEYLEAEFYSWAAFGVGLPADLRGGGPPAMGGQKAMLSPQVQAYAEEIALDEIAHVRLLRRVLGSNAVPQPQIDIGEAFAVVASAAFNTTDLPIDFDPYASDILFLHGAFIFEDVGVTAYKGAAALVQNKDVLTAAAGLLGTEAYHAGAIRALLAPMAGSTVFPFNATVAQIVQVHPWCCMLKSSITTPHRRQQAISDLRDAVDGPSNVDQGLLFDPATNGPPMTTTYRVPTPYGGTVVVQDPRAYRMVNLVPADADSLPFSRTAEQVLTTVYGGATCGVFFPSCINQRSMAPAANAG